jgi:hypothetical protein
MISKEVKDSLITYATIGALAYLFNGIGDAKHDIDILHTKQDHLLNSDAKLWEYVDEDLRWKTELQKEISNIRIEISEEKAQFYKEWRAE